MSAPLDLVGSTFARGKDPFPPHVARALVERVTFGVTPAELALAMSLGHEGYVEHHLDHEAIDDSLVEGLLAPLDDLTKSFAELEGTAEPGALVVLEQKHREATLVRAVRSPRQLHERMVQFVGDHLNIFGRDGALRAHKIIDDREVVRPHAFGKFEELLVASAQGAAMLIYLDNHTNSVNGPQENYARELLELHTLGIGGGYTETDVKEAARCLTGWTYWKPGLGGELGTFRFNMFSHDFTQKTVLGQHFPGGQGVEDGLQLISLVAGHPSTAHFVATKLCRFFLVHDPPASIVDRVAAVYTKTGGDLQAMLRETLSPSAFAATEPWKQPKLKRPLRFATGALRAFDIPLAPATNWDEPTPLLEEFRLLGQRPFDWVDPDGYPDSPHAWGSGMPARWSFASRLLAGESGAATVDQGFVLSALAAAGGTWGHGLDVLLTGGGGLSASDRAALDAHAAGYGAIGWPETAELVALALSCPSYQWM